MNVELINAALHAGASAGHRLPRARPAGAPDPRHPGVLSTGLLAIASRSSGEAFLGVVAGYRGGWLSSVITYFANLLDPSRGWC